MLKKFIFTTILIAIFVGAVSYKAAYDARQRRREERQNAKAPEEKITVIEGWTVQDIGQLLEKKEIIKQADFSLLEAKFDASKFPLLNSKPANADLEGFLFPDTYR